MSLSEAHPVYLTPREKTGFEDLWAWWLIGRFIAFRSKGRGFESRSSRHVGTLDKFFTRSCLWRFSVKLLHGIRAVSGVPLSSGLE